MGDRHGRGRQRMLASRERRRRRLDERRRVAEGAQASLLGQQLLVGHWVDGVREVERWAEQEGEGFC